MSGYWCCETKLPRSSFYLLKLCARKKAFFRLGPRYRAQSVFLALARSHQVHPCL